MTMYRLNSVPANVRALPILQSASGSIASFNTDLTDDLVDCIVDVNAIQDLHGYSNPWPAGGGKNLVNLSDESFTANVNTVKILGDIYLKAGTYTWSYTLSTNLIVTRNRPLYYIDGHDVYAPSDVTTSGRNSWTFTLAQDATIGLRWWVVDNNNAFSLTDFQLEKGSTASAYEPYENICPISGHSQADILASGKNLFNGTYNVLTPCFIPKGSTITFSCDKHNAPSTIFYYYDSNSSMIDYYSLSQTDTSDTRNYNTATLSQNVYYVRFGNASATNMMIEKGNSASEFVPYTGTLYSIPFGQTVYGATLNPLSGKLTITHGYTTIGSIGWGVGDYFYSSISDKAAGNFNIISDNYATTTSPSASDMGNFEIKGHATTTSIYLKDNRYTTTTELINNMGSTLLVYELATPTTIQLSSADVQTIIGNNNIYTDTGDTSLNYWVTIDKYIGS